MPWGAAAAAAAAIGGAMIQSNSAKKASSAQGRASETALEEQQRQFDLAREDLTPWRASGQMALADLNRRLGFGNAGTPPPAPSREQAAADAERQFKEDAYYGRVQSVTGDMVAKRAEENYQRAVKDYSAWQSEAQRNGDGDLLRRFTMNDFENDPVRKASFDFGLSEGTKALNARLRAAGVFKSGAATKELTRYASDYTNQRAGESYNRFAADQDRVYNRLAGVAGTGQTATTNTAQMGANMANNAGNLIVGAANARGAASIAQGNAYGNALNTAGTAYNRQFTLDQILNRGGAAPAGGGGGDGGGGYVSDDYRWSMD